MTKHRMNDLLSHVGYSWIATGTALLAADCSYGWPMRIVGDLLCIYLGVRLRLSGMVMWSFIFLGVDAYGWL